MNIKIHSLIEGAKNAKGIVVIIDVLRACTTVPILFKQGIRQIIPVKEPEEAIPYKKQGYVLIGEAEHGYAHDIFDYNNSPSEVLHVDFLGKAAVLRSNNATQAIHFAEQASDIILGSFLNVQAIVNYIRSHHLNDVTLVALGRLGGPGIEDELCAEVIMHELKNQKYDFEKIKTEVMNCPTAILVRDKLSRPDDVTLAVQLNAYPIVPRVVNIDSHKVIKAV